MEPEVPWLLRMTAQALRLAADSLAEAGAELEHVLATGSPPVSHATRVQAAQLGADSVALATMLVEVTGPIVEHWNATPGMIVMAPLGGSLSTAFGTNAVGRFIVLAKSLFLFTRAYQDAMYGLIFEMVERHPIKNRRMQEAAAKANNPSAACWAKSWPATSIGSESGVSFATP